MSDSPRPANAMSAQPAVTAPSRTPMRGNQVAGKARAASTLLAAALLAVMPASASHLAHVATRAHATAAHAVPSSAARPRSTSRTTHVQTAHTNGHAIPAKHTVQTARSTSRNARQHAAEAPVATAHLSPRQKLAARAAAAQAAAAEQASAARAAAAHAPSHHVQATSSIQSTTLASSKPPAADDATADRVHAWMRIHSTAAQPSANTDEATSTPAPRTVTTARITPDLATSPRKATADDFAQAAQRQTEAIHAIAAQDRARTSTADDEAAAVAESHIPSTAPTARVPLPFAHGDLLANPTQASITGDLTRQQPATLTTRPADAAAPKLDLQKPTPITRNAPAAAAVAAAAKHPALDPTVSTAMSDETFSDNPAPTPATAIALAARTKAPAILADVDPQTLSTGPLPTVDLYDSNGQFHILPPMKGTHEILVHQNQMALADGLDRIGNDNQLYDMRRMKLLVALPDNDAIEVNPVLPVNRRYARPWSVRFLNDLARAHYARFHTPLIITSAVRTVAFQRRLVLTNGNAAPPTGDIASPHLYGQAIDLGKRGMSITEIAWMRAYLTPVEDSGKIDVEEEFQQACFHISVYRRYLGVPARNAAPPPQDPPSRTLLQARSAPAPQKHRRLPTALLATGLR